MNPATVHLNAQLIRHGRGICTAFEKWTTQQVPGQAVQEIRETVAVWRGMLEMVETQLSHQPEVVAPIARTG